MKMFDSKKLLYILLAITVFTFKAESQVSADAQREEDRIKRERDSQQATEAFKQLNDLENKARHIREGSLANRALNQASEIEKNRAAISKLTAPNTEDLSKYKGFLQKSNTGIFRLFPNLNCISGAVIRVDGECANFVPDAWSYSFRQKNYSDMDLPDIRLGKDNLISDGFLSQNLLVELGDVNLEKISLDDGAIKFLADFNPETEPSKAKTQYSRITDGIKVGDYIYSKSLKADENKTYAARLIAYRVKINHAEEFFAKNSQDANKYFKLYADKRVDLIIAFRIIRKEADGGITILWKKLKQQQSAKLTLN